MTVAQAVAWAETALAKAGVPEPRLDAQLLVAHALGRDRSFVLVHADDPFDLALLEPLCERRAAREPLAYILGWREFYGRRFSVTTDVLVPRQETETVVEAALRAIQHVRAPEVLDLGTGSGCIALTIALERPDARVTATDVSGPALEVARRNAEALGPKPQPLLACEPTRSLEVAFVQSDLFAGLKGQRYDLIVSNPPYVATGDDLPPEVSAYEPPTALYAGPDGFEVYRTLAEGAHAFLRPAGALVVEIGDGQSQAVTEIFEESAWHVDEVANDLSSTPRALTLKPLTVG